MRKTQEESIFSISGKKLQGQQGIAEPWLNDDGSYKSDKEIELLGKSWNYRIWDSYFKSIEKPQKEVQSSSAVCIENITEQECAEIFYSCSVGDEFPHLKVAVRSCLNNLTRQQQRMIYMTFWEKKSQYEIARCLNVSRSTVQTTLRHSKKKIKEMMTQKKVYSLSQQVSYLAS